MSAISLGSVGVIGAFFERLHASQGASWINDLALRIDSTQEIETIKWLGQVAPMRQWIGGRQPRAFRDNGFTIQNLKFESSIRVELDEIRRDKTAQVMARINELADRAASHPASLISTLIANGASGLCYDGQYFFDTDHTEGENTTSQSNSIVFDISDGGAGGTPTNPTNTTMNRAILAGISAMMAFKDDQNEPCNEFLTDFLVMAPPSLQAQAMAATASAVLDQGQTNLIVAQNSFRVRPVVNPRLTAWTDKVAVFGLNGTQKPFINQVEVDTTLSAKAEGSDFEHDNDAHEYGAKRVGNAAYGDWKKACLVTLQA